MQGTFVFKPLQAHLNQNKAAFGKMNPYCEVKLGNRKIKSQVARAGGKDPQWVDVIITRSEGESQCKILIKDQSTFRPDRKLGVCTIDLKNLAAQKRVTRWVGLYNKEKREGELLIEMTYRPDGEEVQETPRRVNLVLDNSMFSNASTDDFEKLIR